MERRYAASDDDDEESEEDFVRVSSGSEGGEEGQIVEHYLSEKEGGDQEDSFDFVVMSDHEEEGEEEGEEEANGEGGGGGALAESGGLVGGEDDEEEEEDDEDILPRRVLQQRSQDELEEEERFLSFQNLQQRRRHQREKKQLLGGRRDYRPHRKRKQDPSKPQEEDEEEQEKREGQEERPYSSSSGYASGSGSASSSSSDNVKEEEGEANQGSGDSPSLSSSSNEHHAKRTSTALLLSTSSDGLLPSSSSTPSSSHSAQQQLSASSEKHQQQEEPEEQKRGRFASWWPFVTAFFVTVATVLGTGILGLPIRVADSGFTPMLLTYTWGVVMQALVLFFMVELLQRTKIVQDQQDRQNQQRTQLSRASLRDQELGFITPLQFNPARTSTIKDEERRHKRSHKRQEMPDEEDYYLSGSEEEESRRSTSTEVRDSEEFVPIELADEDYEYHEGEEEYGANEEEEEEEEEHDALESGRIRRGSHRRRELGRIRYVQMAGTEQEGYLQCYGKEFGGLEKGPDLHTMGSLFLGRYLRHVFDAAVMLHFISILISYSLAASEAYAHIMNVPHTLLILPFIILFGSVVIFGSLFISGIISFLTLGKGFLLIMMVVVTGIVGAEADHPISNNWRYVGQPFLIGTVALGGAANTLPVVFAKIGFCRKDMIKLTAATVLGLFTTYVLNIIWCYYVLKIVPQHGGSISLELAGEEGHIATVPLIDIIRRDFPEYRWIAVLVDVFIMVSVTVSFITVGIGLKHTLDGYVKNWKARDFHFEWFSAKTNFILERLWNAPPLYRQSFLYSICFGIVMLFAQANPKSFLVVMEVVTSLALNIESGCLVVVMLGTSRLLQHNLSIPYVLPAWLFQLRWPVLFYFTFAVFYDLLSVVFQIVN